MIPVQPVQIISYASLYLCLIISEIFLPYIMMASVDAEAEMENLFAGDDFNQDGGMENTQSLTQEEG